MVDSLSLALEMDVKESAFRNNEKICKLFLKSLLYDAYLGKDGHNYVHAYVRSHGRDLVVHEIYHLASLEKPYENDEQMLDCAVETLFSRFSDFIKPSSKEGSNRR